MKKITLVLTWLTLSFHLIAQESNIQWGTMKEEGGAMASYIPLGWAGNHYYAVQAYRKDASLIKVNNEMNIEDQTELITGQDKFEADVMFIREGKIHMLTSEYEGSIKTNSVRVTSFTLDGKITSVKYKKIADVKVGSSGENTDMRYFFSLDSSMLLMLEEHDMGAKDNAKVSITVVATDGFTSLWHSAQELPYNDNSLSILSAAVEANGNVLLLASIKGEEGNKLDRYYSQIFSFDTEGNQSEKEFKLEGKFISSANIRFVSEDKAFITGFYNELTATGKSEGVEGAFVTVVDPLNLQDINVHVKAMDPDVKTAITRTGALAELFQADELNAYSIQEMNVNADGSGYVIAEQRLVVQRREQTSVYRSYYFNHLIIYRFDHHQDIYWIASIPKQQLTTISTPVFGIGPLAFWYFPGSLIRLAYKYNSFISTEKDGNIYVLYNDHADNGDARTLKDTKLMNNKNKAMATLVTVDAQGEWNKEQLFRGKDMEVILETSCSFGLVEGGFTLSAERGKNLQYGKLKL